MTNMQLTQAKWGELKIFPLKSEQKRGTFLLFNIILETLERAIRQKKEMKDTNKKRS